jgi:hypothetical protein
MSTRTIFSRRCRCGPRFVLEAHPSGVVFATPVAVPVAGGRTERLVPSSREMAAGEYDREYNNEQ